MVRFYATAGCNRRRCAVSHFRENLLPAAVVAPAVAVCLKSLLFSLLRQELVEKKNNHLQKFFVYKEALSGIKRSKEFK